MKANFLIFFSFLLIKSINGFSQAGNLDSTFNSTGVGAFIFGSICNGQSVAIQPDGKIVVGGTTATNAFALARYNMDGTLDKSFGANGKDSIYIGIDGDIRGYVVLQPDGKILLGGSCVDNQYRIVFSLSRFNTNGSIDNSFNGNGSINTSFNNSGYSDRGYAIALQPDGKIVQVGGTTIWHVMSFQDSLDEFALVRYNANGTLDNSFGNGGKVTTLVYDDFSQAYAVSIQPDGKIIAGGGAGSLSAAPACFAMVRYNTDGTIDTSFGAKGRVITFFGAGDSTGINYENDQAQAMALQPDGKIILAGNSELGSDTYGVLRFARYNSNGTLDSSFGIGGKVATPCSAIIYSICLQQDGKIILAGLGSSNPDECFLSRFNTNGSVDSSFGKNGFVFLSLNNSGFSELNMATMQGDGKIVAAGYSDVKGMIVLRFLSGLNLGVLNFSSPQNPLLIYPNPISKQATLQYSLSQTESISLTLTDMLGRQVQTFFTNQQREQGEHKEELQLSNTLAAGNYILSISNGHNSQGVKVSVVR
jgi:uncharacterized delta-60 repeat protein